MCLSTNGLMLPNYIDEIQKYNVDHVTVTINSVDETGEKKKKFILGFYGIIKKIFGKSCKKSSLKDNLEGNKMLTERGILVKQTLF